MNGRIAKKKAEARFLLWWGIEPRLWRKRGKLRRMNRKTRHLCQRFANDLGGA